MSKKHNYSTGFHLLLTTSITAFLFITIGCRSQEIIPEEYEPDASHSDYVYALQQLSIADSTIGIEWIRSGDPQAATPLPVTLPFLEQRLLDSREQYAAWYLIEGLRGHQIDIDVSGPEDASYFLDVFRLPEDYRPKFVENFSGAEENSPWKTGMAEKAASAGGIQSIESHIHFEPQRHRWYLVRIQPRLLEGGEFTIRFQADAALGWPVPGTDHRDIWSFFGAPRDGGTRIHHGVDIFAPRHTALVSISEENSVRIGERERGGLTVNLTDHTRGLRLYYAHLEDQEHDLHNSIVPSGTVIGTLGNSGNAVTTPPHLHIGIYEGSWRSPLDPWYFIVPLDTIPPPIAQIPTAGIGEYIELSDTTAVFSLPPQQSAVIPSPAITDGSGQRLPPSAYPTLSIPARIISASDLESVAAGSRSFRYMGITGNYIRIRFSSGTYGFIPAADLSG